MYIPVQSITTIRYLAMLKIAINAWLPFVVGCLRTTIADSMEKDETKFVRRELRAIASVAQLNEHTAAVE